MNIYFTASLSGKKKFEENYEQIVSLLEDIDYDVQADHILDIDASEVDEESMDDRRKHHKQLQKWLSQSDLVVAEVSYPSVSVGYEVALAINKNKPVLALYEKDHAPVALLGEDSDKFVAAAYDKYSLADDIKYLIDEVSGQMDTRFNFFISPRHQNYLDWIAKEKRIPRSVFLRQLIEEHMHDSDEYF